MSVIIATLDRPEPLRRTLESIRACSPPPHEIIVVDGSTEASALAVVEEFTPGQGPNLLHLPAARGLTKQRNAGLARASGDIAVFFDDDVIVAPDVFARLGNAYDDTGTVGATGMVIEAEARAIGGRSSPLRRLVFGSSKEGTFTSFGYPRRLTDPYVARDVEFMQGCFMSARLDVARRIGFDEALPGYALAEDEDFSFRLSRQGRIRYLPDAVVRHENTGFTTHDRRSFGRAVVVNRAYLFRKNFSPSIASRAGFVFLMVLLIGHRLLNREFSGARGLIEGSIAVLRGRS